MQTLLRERADQLKQTIRNIQSYVRSGTCPIATMQRAGGSTGAISLQVDDAYSKLIVAPQDALPWSVLGRGELAEALRQLAPVGRVLAQGSQGRLQFRDLLDHVRTFAALDKGVAGERIGFKQVC